MDRDSSARRLLTLLSLLQSRPHWTAAELSDRLSVTRRTVRRDMTRLRDLGYPVLAEPGPNGGYQLGAGGALPPLLLNDDEAVAVVIGLRAAASGGVAGFEDTAVAALAKLEQVLPARLRERVAAFASTTVLLRSVHGPQVSPDVLLLLAQGCRGLERLRFNYQDRQGQESQRRVEPYRLVNTARRWYLVAQDVDRKAWRTFRVDRLSDPELTGHRFTRETEPDAAKMVADGLAQAPYPYQAEVFLEVSPTEAADYIGPTSGSLEALNGGTLLRLGANDLEWMVRYLAGLPFAFEVRQPPEVRAALRDHGKRIHTAHR